MKKNSRNIKKVSCFKRVTTLAAAFTLAVGVASFAPVRTIAFAQDNQDDGQPQHHSEGYNCVTFNLPMSAADGQPQNWKVWAQYCQPQKWASSTHQVDVLTSGATYNSMYWDWPQDDLSYVKKTLSAGRATLNYDRVGTGKSSIPVSTDITLDSDAYVLHKLVDMMHTMGHEQVNSIGHSYGGTTAVQEAGTYHDVSRVVISDYLHGPRNSAITQTVYSATEDPKFKDSGLDADYLTTKPGTRGGSYYYAQGADKKVIAYDELHKDVVAKSAFIGYVSQQGAPADTNISNSITVPVLVIAGQQDAVFCSQPNVLDCTDTAKTKAFEAPYYAHAPKFEAYTIPKTGHDLALHYSADDSFKKIDQWIKNN